MESNLRVKTVLLSVLLLLSLAFEPGHCSGCIAPEFPVLPPWGDSRELAARRALLSLKDGQTLRFEVRRVHLNKRLIIKASNVVLIGIPQKTLVFSYGMTTLLIRGTNVTLHRLEFSGWYPSSALRIEKSMSGLTTTDGRDNVSIESKRNIHEHRKNTVYVSECLFRDILGDRGAAITAKRSELTIRNSTFVGNKASDCAKRATLGGAVRVYGGKVVIDTSDFVNNRCYGGSGGAIAFENCETVIVSNSTFTSNSVKEPEWEPEWPPEVLIYERGGGIYASNCGTVSFINSRFLHNEGIDGGGGVYASNCSALLAINSTFEDNAVSSDGGGIYTKECTAVNISSSRLEINWASNDGGGIYTKECTAVNISSSRLEGNYAGGNGGGVYTESTDAMSVEKSRFEKNLAQVTGGALCAISDNLVIADSDFVDNIATERGGAVGLQRYGSSADLCNVTLKKNSATLGGAVSLPTFTSLSHCKRSESRVTTVRFLGNTAFRGGGVDVTKNFLFKNNVAAESGGGMYLEESVESHINAKFIRNVASFGGGAYLTDCRAANLPSAAEFHGNMAIDGGGLHITSLHGRTAAYRLLEMKLVSNRALNNISPTEEVNNPVARRWAMERKKALLKGHPEWIKGREKFHGRGGGLFIMFRNSREESRDFLELYDVSITNNSATIGGGIYIDNGRRIATRKEWRTEGQTWSPCFFVWFEGVKIINNIASIAGGGMFVRRAKGAFVYGISKVDNTCDDCYGWTIDPERRGHYECDSCFDSNRVESSGDVGYGPQSATGASSLVLRNVEGSITGLSVGDKLAVRHKDKNTAATDFEEITLIVRDALDQHVTGNIEDAELAVVLVSNWISGERRYEAKNGVIRINSTFVAGVNISDVLVFQSDDERRLSVTLNFTTSPCLDGEVPIKTQSQCFRCPSQTYTFNATDEGGCRPCEKNAVCPGTVSLVPKDGYWHSNPFSPFIRRCPLKEACEYVNRTTNLTRYYTDPDIANKLQCFTVSTNAEAKNCSEGYIQCAEGYEGVLCGTCAGDYGHSSGGECKFCSQSLTAAWIFSLLGIIVLFLVLTGKVALGVDGVRKYVAENLQQEKRAIRSALLRTRSRTHSPAQEETAPDGGGESVHPPSEIEGQDGAGTADHPAEEGTSVEPPQTRPLLERVEEHIEDPGTDTESEGNTPISAALSAASELLVSTYNILFNYVQLSTVAPTLDVDWQSALKYFFALNSVLGRVMRIEILPIDCTFSDRGHDVGVPNSLAVLWLRISFPFAVVAVYLTIGAVTKLFRSGKKTSKYKIDFLPSLRLVFFVVYLAYCIDIVSDLLKIMHCHDLSDDVWGSHPYSAFEELKSGTVWIEDTSVTCWRGAHRVSAIFAAMGLCLCLAVIVSMIVILYRGGNRRQLKRSGFISSYGILFLAYRTEGLALHWESVITVRKMLLAGVEVYSSHSETSGVQIGLLAIVIFAALALQDIVRPFQEENEEATFPAYAGDEVRLIVPESWRQMWVDFNSSVTLNGLEAASLFMSLSFFLVAGCISDENASDKEVSVLLGACFFLNAVFFFFMIYRLWYGVHQYLDALANDCNFSFTSGADRVEDRKTYLVIKIWKWLTFKPEQEEEGSAAHDAA